MNRLRRGQRLFTVEVAPKPATHYSGVFFLPCRRGGGGGGGMFFPSLYKPSNDGLIESSKRRKNPKLLLRTMTSTMFTIG